MNTVGLLLLHGFQFTRIISIHDAIMDVTSQTLFALMQLRVVTTATCWTKHIFLFVFQNFKDCAPIFTSPLFMLFG